MDFLLTLATVNQNNPLWIIFGNFQKPLTNFLMKTFIHFFIAVIVGTVFDSLKSNINGNINQESNIGFKPTNGSILDGLDNLRRIDLSQNKITYIWGLKGMKNIQSLNLSNNNIEYIDGIETYGFKNLQVLQLCNNKIKNIKFGYIEENKEH